MKLRGPLAELLRKTNPIPTRDEWPMTAHPEEVLDQAVREAGFATEEIRGLLVRIANLVDDAIDHEELSGLAESSFRSWRRDYRRYEKETQES